MKRAYFACLFLCLTTTFLLSQRNPLLPINRRTRVVPPVSASQVNPKAQARVLNQYGKLPLSFEGRSLDASSIFLEAPTYSAGGVAVALTTADVNGDGKLDLIVANDQSNTVGVLLGNGDGTFQAAVTYGSGGYGALSVAVADVNGDGKPDLLVANECAGNCEYSSNGSVGVLLGNGDGTFQPAVSYNSGGAEAYSVAVGDVNGDGKLDLIVANDNAVGVLLGNGDGTFQPAVSYNSGGSSVAVADVNGDGKLDLVVSSLTGGSVSVFLGNGDGTFQPAVGYNSGGWGFFSSVAVADVNGDGKPDLLVANHCASSSADCRFGSAGVLLGNGDGTFQAVQNYSSEGFAPDSIAVADVNGDGKKDLLIANVYAAGGATYGTVGVLFGNGDGTFQAAQTYATDGPAEFVAVGDVNRDGKPDLLVANGNVDVFFGNGDGTFQAAPNYTLALTADGGEVAVAAADVNGDGKPDVLAAYCGDSSCTGEVSVLLGNGNGTFRLGQAYATGGGYPSSIAIADVNGDGKPDLLAVNEFATCSGSCVDGSVGVLLGNGDGTFQPAQTYSSGGEYAGPIVVADVNGDGKPDFLVGNYYDGSGYSDGTVLVLLGNGDGTFQPAQRIDSGGVGALSIALADVNGDGKPDLLVANDCASLVVCTNGSVTVLLGNGNGTFQPAVSYNSGGARAYSVAVGDVNGDGNLDLIVANQYAGGSDTNSNVSVLFGNGDGTFQTAMSTTTPPWNDEPEAIAVDDFNGDGKLDVATSLGFLLLGNGDGTFQSPLLLGVAGTGIAVGDLNLDGKPDLVMGDIGILLNIASGFRYATTTKVISSLNPASLSQTVIFTASVTPAFSAGAITGGVTFYDGTTALGNVAISNGQGIFNASSLSVGMHPVTASYSGDTNYLPSTSASLNQTVNQASTTLTLTSSVNPSGLDQPVTFTAMIVPQYGGQASGTVTFKDGSTVLGSGPVSGNAASLTTSGLAMGTHSITAIYSGDSNFTGSTSNTVSQVVTKATTTTTLASSMNPSVQGKPVTFAASVSSLAGTPTGKIEYLNGTTVLATLRLTSGSAKYTTSKLQPGANIITVVYEGDSNNNGSTSAPVNQFVLAATTTTLSSSPNPSTYGQAVTFTAVVISSLGAPPDGESVTFMEGKTVLGTGVLSGGSATFTTSALPVRTNVITAVYGGGSNFVGSTSRAVKQVVSKTTTTTALASSVNPSHSGQSVTFTASVTPQFSGAVTGKVAFYDGTTLLKTVALSRGAAKFTTSKLTSGTHSITATYNGSTSFDGSSSAPLTQTVD
jgi:hypothetical protein